MKKNIYALYAILTLSLCSCCGISQNGDKPEFVRINPDGSKSSVMIVSNFNMLLSGNPKWGNDWTSKPDYFNKHLFNWWQVRKPRIVSIIRFHDFDIVGTQELMPFQIDELAAMIPEYKWVGKPDRRLHKISEFMYLGKERAEFEVSHSMMFNTIFYRADRFQLVEDGQFNLSDTPDNPGAIGFSKENGQRRMCVWAKFREKATGLEFAVFNTHLNSIYKSQNSPDMLKSTALILSKIKEIAKDKPFFLTGDFNMEMDKEPLQNLLKSGIMQEAYQISKLPPHGAYNSNPNEVERNRIDHIFVSKQITVDKYAVLTDHVTTDEKKGNFFKKAARYASDHYPCMAKVSVQLKK